MFTTLTPVSTKYAPYQRSSRPEVVQRFRYYFR